MRNSRIAAALLVAALAGCGTTERFKEKMSGFVGQPESAVLAAYGAPTSFYQATDGTRAIRYRRGGTTVMPGLTTYQPVRVNTTGTASFSQNVLRPPVNATYSQQSTAMVPVQGAPTSINLWCEVTFMLDLKGIVQSWSADGNHCTAK